MTCSVVLSTVALCAGCDNAGYPSNAGYPDA
jgi:hypothetical protein